MFKSASISVSHFLFFMTLASHERIKIFGMFLVENKNLKEIVDKLLKTLLNGKKHN